MRAPAASKIAAPIGIPPSANPLRASATATANIADVLGSSCIVISDTIIGVRRGVTEDRDWRLASQWHACAKEERSHSCPSVVVLLSQVEWRFSMTNIVSAEELVRRANEELDA